MLNNLRDPKYSLFSTVPEKGGNGAQFLETMMMIVGSNDVKFGYILKFLTYYHQQDLTLGVF